MGNSRRHPRSSAVKSRLRLQMFVVARTRHLCLIIRRAFSPDLKLRVAGEESAAPHLVATGLEGFFFSHTCFKVTPVVLFRNLNNHVLAVVFNHGEDKRPMGCLLAHNFLALLYRPSEPR